MAKRIVRIGELFQAFIAEKARQCSLQQVDYVNGFNVFNIGRSCRLIAAVKFRAKLVYVRHVLIHAEYDKGKWKPK